MKWKKERTQRHGGTQSREKEKMAQERQKGHVERESQDRVETAESEKGKMSNEQGERVTISSQREQKKGRQDRSDQTAPRCDTDTQSERRTRCGGAKALLVDKGESEPPRRS